MSDLLFLLLMAGMTLVLVLQIVLLLRQPKIELPAELLARLTTLEQSSRATLQASAKTEGVLDSLTQQIHGFTQATLASLEANRRVMDEKLAQTVAESRQGRVDLTNSLGDWSLEGAKSREVMAQSSKLFEVHIRDRFEALSGTTRQTLDALKTDINSQLGVMSGALKDQLEGNANQIRDSFRRCKPRCHNNSVRWSPVASKTPSSCVWH